MELYTIREAADLTGVSVHALRRRADRETIRTVKKNGKRYIPRQELERAGLRIGQGPATVKELVAELTETIRQQERELTALRALPEKVSREREELTKRIDAVCVERDELAHELAVEKKQQDDLAEKLDLLASAGFWERRKLLKTLTYKQQSS